MDVLDSVLPDLADRIRLVIAWGISHNRDVRVGEAFRSPSYQMGLFEEGRANEEGVGWHIVDESKVVTNALPEKAPHCRRAAVDCGIYEEGKLLTCDASKLSAAEYAREVAEYFQMGAYGESVGLVWGGRWKSIKDYDHFELPNWRALPFPPVAPPEAA